MTTTISHNETSETANSIIDSSEDVVERVPECCINTIELHGLHNPMMVCLKCKQIIKCFRNEKEYKNYLIFCKSRRRKVATGKVGEYFTAVFKPYQSSFE